MKTCVTHISKNIILFSTLVLLSCGIQACSSENKVHSQAKKEIESQLLHCGDSWYGRGTSGFNQLGFLEMKGLSIKIYPQQLSDADKANGIEWKGEVVVEAKLYREFDNAKGWGEWRDGRLRRDDLGFLGGGIQGLPLFNNVLAAALGTAGKFYLTIKKGQWLWPYNFTKATALEYDCQTIPK